MRLLRPRLPASVVLCVILLSYSRTALAEGTQVIAWGGNDGGQTNVPAGLTNAVMIAARTNTLAVTADGRVVVWGDDETGRTDLVPAGLTNVVAAALGGVNGGFALALTADGYVTAWGKSWNGETNVPTGLSNVVAVAAGARHCLALTEDGHVVNWGDDSAVPADLSNVVAVAAGFGYSMALIADGRVRAWGYNYIGATVPVELTNAVAIAAGGFSYIAATAEGRVMVWGTSPLPPYELTNIVAIGAGDDSFAQHCLGLTANGQVAAWGNNGFGQASVPASLDRVVAVSAGFKHSVALRDPDGLTAWKLSPPRITTNGVTLDLQTQRGRLYIVEQKTAFDSSWSVIKRLAGNGSLHSILLPAQQQVFYRARRIP